jgi:Carboxypeptidase regulatory-like domain
MRIGRVAFSCTMVITAVIVLWVLWAPGYAQDATNSVLIEGLVSRHTSGDPVEGVSVTVISETGAKYSVSTGSNGSFSFKGIPSGHYSLIASRSDFLPYDSDQHPAGISVSPGQQLKDLRIHLTPTSTITGRVLNSNHQPVVDAVVMAIQPTFVNGRTVLIPDLANTRFFFPIGTKLVQTWEYPKAITDDRGYYRIFGLAPGAYYVSVWSAGAETLEEATTGINRVPGFTKDQPPVYYPSVIDPDNSIPIRVDGEERQGIDFEIRNQTLHRFTFEVDSSNIPPKPCYGIGDAEEAIVLIRHTPKLDVIQYSSRFGNSVFKKGEEKKWVSPALPAGAYEIFFEPCMFTGYATVGSLAVNLADRDVDAGKIVIPLSSSVPGRLRTAGVPSVSLDKLQVRLRPLDLRSASVSMAPKVTIDPVNSAKDDITFSANTTIGRDSFATASPGPYQIDIAGIPEDVYVASVKHAGREVRDSGFNIDTDPPGPLEVTLSPHGGVVEGIVKDQLGKPSADSIVALMPSNRDLVYSNLFWETRTGQDGTFSLRGIPPGEYGLIAVENLAVGETRSPEFRDEYQSRILSISLKQNSKEKVSLISVPR